MVGPKVRYDASPPFPASTVAPDTTSGLCRDATEPRSQPPLEEEVLICRLSLQALSSSTGAGGARLQTLAPVSNPVVVCLCTASLWKIMASEGSLLQIGAACASAGGKVTRDAGPVKGGTSEIAFVEVRPAFSSTATSQQNQTSFACLPLININQYAAKSYWHSSLGCQDLPVHSRQALHRVHNLRVHDLWKYMWPSGTAQC